MDHAYSNINDYNPKRKIKILIVFDDMIADIKANKKFIIQAIIQRVVFILFSLVFITQSYFIVPTEVRLKSTHYLIMKIHNKRELQKIAVNHSADFDYKDFLKIYRNCTNKLYSFLTIDTTLPADNPMRFRKNFSDLPL